MTLHVHFQEALDEAALAALRSHLNGAIRITVGPARPSPADYHILVAGRPAREGLPASPNVRALIIPWAGVPEKTRKLLAEFPSISVHNLHHNAAATAEMGVALLLAAAKFLVPMDRQLRQGDWTPRYRPSPALALNGKTAIILGFGEIGRRVGLICRAMGMRVLATRRSPDAPSLPNLDAEVYSASALHDLLPQADALAITLPLTPDTRGLIGQAELALLPPKAILVNLGRGPIVDEAALYHALRSGALGAAGLDVWYNYPEDEATRAHTPPSAFPFHELDNVVMSPHRGGFTSETDRDRMKHLAEMLNTAARGAPMPNQVDLQLGY